MSATISAATGKPYGIQRVCDAWEMPRSSFYTRKARRIESPVLQKRGPKTLVIRSVDVQEQWKNQSIIFFRHPKTR